MASLWKKFNKKLDKKFGTNVDKVIDTDFGKKVEKTFEKKLGKKNRDKTLSPLAIVGIFVGGGLLMFPIILFVSLFSLCAAFDDGMWLDD